MCYMLLLGTDSNSDLTAHNCELISFHRALPGLKEEELLKYPEKWFVASKSGCSCSFRHLYVGSVELGFGEPEDWYPEEPEDIEATLIFIGIIRKLVSSGAGVECIDAWSHSNELATLSCVEVNLADVSNSQFRFFENHKFFFISKN
jgi:hypothetical protein